MDEFAYYNSQNENKTEFIFSNLQHVWIPDQNNGSYPNGQVIFDCASLTNSSKFVDFTQSYMTVPLIMANSMTGATTSSAENAFATSLKSGYHQLINSMSVEITNCQVVNLTNFSNLDINYKLLTTCCLDDERNFLPSLNFSKDTAESISYSGVNSVTGIGEYNNVISQSLFFSTNGYGESGWNFNNGRLQRMLNTSFDPTNGVNGSANSNLVNISGTKTVAKNYYTTGGNTDSVHYIVATIPLKILHDLFRKLPLIKGAYARLIFNLNAQCQCAISLTAGAYSGYQTTSLNNVFPCMVSPIGTGSGLVLSGATGLTVSLGIAKSYNTSTS